MAADQPTPTFGITAETRKAVTRAASELSQAINALVSHHREEAKALPTAAGDLARAGNQAEEERARWGPDAARLEEIAADLRQRRSRLLDKLEALRDQLVDLGAETRSLLPEEALSTFFVEPYKSESAPRPIAGIEEDLGLADWVRVLLVNVEWTHKWTEIWVVEALGPCYMLSIAIEHPTVEASELRKSLEETCGMLKRFLLKQYT